MIFNHGCVTDAAHKFFTNGKLLVTCCYFEVLHRWQPIFLSWIGRQTAKTYEHHFFRLFQSIGNELKVNDETIALWTVFQQIVGTVVDFSDAQRIGFQAAYAKFMTTTATGVQCQISKWVDETEGNNFSFLSYDEHYNIGGSLLKGCRYHWKESVTKIAQNRNVISEDQQSEFHHLISMLSTVDTISEFNSTARLILTKYPNAKSWLEWWLQAEQSRMLFPVVKAAIGDDQTPTQHLQGLPTQLYSDFRNI